MLLEPLACTFFADFVKHNTFGCHDSYWKLFLRPIITLPDFTRLALWVERKRKKKSVKAKDDSQQESGRKGSFFFVVMIGFFFFFCHRKKQSDV